MMISVEILLYLTNHQTECCYHRHPNRLHLDYPVKPRLLSGGHDAALSLEYPQYQQWNMDLNHQAWSSPQSAASTTQLIRSSVSHDQLHGDAGVDADGDDQRQENIDGREWYKNWLEINTNLSVFVNEVITLATCSLAPQRKYSWSSDSHLVLGPASWTQPCQTPITEEKIQFIRREAIRYRL